jgi:hypothetical protein
MWMKDAEEVMGLGQRMDDTLGQGPPKKNSHFVISDSGPLIPPPPPPPPTVKSRTVEGVRNPLSAIDLCAARSTVDLSTFFILHVNAAKT